MGYYWRMRFCRSTFGLTGISGRIFDSSFLQETAVLTFLELAAMECNICNV